MLVLSACNIVFISFIEKKGRRPFFDLISGQVLFRKGRVLGVITCPLAKKAAISYAITLQYALDIIS